MPSLLPEGKQKFFGNDGRPLVGGKIFTFAAGTNTPKPTFTDSAGTTPQTNPVILDSRGEALMFWDGAYKIQLTDALDNILWTVDNVRELIPDYRTSSTGSIVTPVGTTAQRDLNPAIGFFRFNTTTNGFEGFVSGQWKPIVFDSADVTLSSSSTVAGAVKLDNPGGATRSFTQWTGAAYAGFLLNVPGGIVNTPTGNILSTTVQGAINELDTSKVQKTTNVLDNTNLNTVVTSGFYRILSTPTNGPAVTVDDGQLIVSRGLDTIFQLASRYQDTRTFIRSGNGPDVGGIGAYAPWRELVTTSATGKTLIGSGVTDDGVTALQTTSYSASNQPSLTGGFGSGFTNSTGGVVSLPINTKVLKGGMTVSASNLIVTVPIAGTYLVTGSTIISSASGSATRLSHGVGISVSGGFDISAGSQLLANAELTYIVSSRSVSLLAGDTISLIGFCSGSPSSNFQLSNFSVVKIN